jgi:hypothetical protein
VSDEQLSLCQPSFASDDAEEWSLTSKTKACIVISSMKKHLLLSNDNICQYE